LKLWTGWDIVGYDEKIVRDTLDLLLRDRKNEFRELAKLMKIPRTSEDGGNYLKILSWFWGCVKTWTDDAEPNTIKNTKCMTIIREISRGKKHIHEIIHLQNIANTIHIEFHQIYKRIS
jgi:hypothetical protein